MNYAAFAIIPIMIGLLILLVLAILMPYYVYRMNRHLEEINHKISTLITIANK
jgi:uncharacterized membrane protein